MADNTSDGKRTAHRFVVISTDVISSETWTVVRDTQTDREYLWVGLNQPILMEGNNG